MSMNDLVIDASAWIEYLDGTPLGMKIKDYLLESKGFTSSVTLAEVISRVKRSKRNVQIASAAISSNSDIINLNDESAFRAGLLHAEAKIKNKKFSLSDAIVLQTALDLNAKVLTCDFDFIDYKNVILIKK